MKPHVYLVCVLPAVLLAACGGKNGGGGGDPPESSPPFANEREAADQEEKRQVSVSDSSLDPEDRQAVWWETYGQPLTDEDLQRYLRSLEMKASEGAGLDDDAIIRKVGLSRTRWGWIHVLVGFAALGQALDDNAEKWGETRKRHVSEMEKLLRSWLPRLLPLWKETNDEWHVNGEGQVRHE